uniref:Uncharacterized protein n=1 Tax=Anopheles maculatus TaxID=74869 RepID=A0A182T9H6_9DIPT
MICGPPGSPEQLLLSLLPVAFPLPVVTQLPACDVADVSCICRRRFSVSMRYVAAVSFSRGLLVVDVSVSSELSDTLRPLPTDGCCCPFSSSSCATSTPPPPSTSPPPMRMPPSSVASASFTSVRQLLFVLEFTVPPLSIDFCEWAVSAFFSCCLAGVIVAGPLLSS